MDRFEGHVRRRVSELNLRMDSGSWGVVTESYGLDISRTFKFKNGISRKTFVKTSSWLSVVTLKKLFLPKGYPLSVSEDYRKYQIWDTIQAFASSVTGALASQAVLVGVGVGDSSATIFGATLSWMFRDGAGMIGRIMFAGWKGFVADILNDCALFLELISPHIGSLFTPIVCCSNLFKSLVSVAGSATRASIMQHQAIANNLADVSAKDGSQETLSNLIAWFFNFGLLYLVTGNQCLIWLCFIILTFVHLYANLQAVKSLQLKTFNRTRFHLAIQPWLMNKFIHCEPFSFPSINWINRHEPILFNTYQSKIYLGCSLYKLPMCGQKFLFSLLPQNKDYDYHLYCPDWKLIQRGIGCKRFETYIILFSYSKPLDQLKAMLHVELLWFINNNKIILERHPKFEKIINAQHINLFAKYSMDLLSEVWEELYPILSKSSWKMDTFQFCADEWRIEKMN